MLYRLMLALFFCTLPLTAQRTYKVGMIHWIANAPLNVADANGFWKEQGLAVRVINFGSNQELNNALAHKRIDIGLDMMGSWVHMFQNGVPLTILGETNWSNGGDKIIVAKDFDMAQIKGKRVGLYLDQASVTFFLDRYLRANQLKLSDITVVELEPDAITENFIAGRFPMIVNYDPQALRAEREGNGRVVATSKDYPGCIPEGFVAHSDVFATIPKEDLSKFFRGWIKALAWSNDPANWEAFKKILNERTFEGEAPYPDEDIRQMLRNVSLHDKTEMLKRNKDGGGLETYLTQLRDFLQENGRLKKPIQPEVLFQNDVLVGVLSQ